MRKKLNPELVTAVLGHVGLVYQVACRLTKNGEEGDAQRLSQKILAQALVQPAGFTEKCSLKTWLLTRLRYHFLNP